MGKELLKKRRIKTRDAIIAAPEGENGTDYDKVKIELETSIKANIEGIHALLFQDNIAYNPQMLKFDAEAQQVHKNLLAINAKMEQTRTALDVRLDSANQSGNLIKIILVLKEKDELIKTTFEQLKPLRAKLAELEQLTDPANITINQFYELYNDIINTYNKLIEPYAQQESGINTYKTGFETFDQIKKLILEIENTTIRTAEETLSIVTDTQLTPELYLALINTRKKLKQQEEVVTKLHTDLNNQLIFVQRSKELEILKNLSVQLYILRSRYECHPLVHELEKILLCNTNGVYKFKFNDREFDIAPEKKLSSDKEQILSNAYQKTIDLIKRYQNAAKVQEEIDYLLARKKVYKAFGILSYKVFERLDKAQKYDFEDIGNNQPQEATYYFDNLISLSYLLLQTGEAIKHAKAITKEFEKNFPELSVLEDSQSFCYEDQSYPLDKEQTPFAINYIATRITLLEAIENGDTDGIDYTAILLKLTIAKKELEQYISNEHNIEMLKDKIRSLQDEIQETIASIPNLPPKNPQSTINDAFINMLRDLIRRIETTDKQLSNENVKSMSDKIANNRTEFVNLCSEYKKSTADNVILAEIDKLKADINSQIKEIESIKRISTRIISQIEAETNRVIRKYNNNEPRIAILNTIKQPIIEEIRKMDEIIKTLHETHNTADEPKKLKENKKILHICAEKINEEKDQLQKNIQESLADERIEKLTLAKKNILIAFIYKYILRPIYLYYHKSRAININSTFFINATELKLKNIRNELLLTEDKEEPEENINNVRAY